MCTGMTAIADTGYASSRLDGQFSVQAFRARNEGSPVNLGCSSVNQSEAMYFVNRERRKQKTIMH